MDLLLGLSLTSAAVRWVLVEGSTGQGEPVDRGELDIPSLDTLDAELLLHAVLNPDVIPEHRIRVVGVTATADAQHAAVAVVEALEARGLNVVPVTDDAAVAALASGIVGITEYDDVDVCIVEPDAAFVALVDEGQVTVEHIERPADRADAVELTSSVIAAVDERKAEAIYVIGSEDVGSIVSSFEAIVDVPVVSATEADLALARGAVLVAARTLDMTGPQPIQLSFRPSRSYTGLISSVLAVAVVTFVVSVSIALGHHAVRETPRAENITAADDSKPLVAPPRPSVAYPDAPKLLAETMIPKAPPAPIPVAEPVAPPPAAPPPAALPPVVQAPAAPPPPPRLRDRILDHIPIIGRLHQGQ